MKYLTLIPITLALFVTGCSHSEFDVSPDQVSKKLTIGPLGGHGMPDLDHLPPGAVKHEVHYKKGDQLPDGSIADGNRKVITIEMPHETSGSGSHKQMKIQTVEAQQESGR